MTCRAGQVALRSSRAASLEEVSSLGYARPDAPRRLLVAVLSACALMLFGASAAGAAATSGTDLGAPNYTGYCQHLGFEQATISNAAYVCLHTDKSTSPIELQAACEFSFAQRPIAEENAFPGIIYTQHCYQTSSGGGPGSGPTPGVTAAQISAALQRGLLPGGAAARASRSTGTSSRRVPTSRGASRQPRSSPPGRRASPPPARLTC
jgi:hypothetical protein